MRQLRVFLLLTILSILSALPAISKNIAVTGNIYDRRTAGHLPDTEIRILTPDSILAARTTASKETSRIYGTSVNTVMTGEFTVELSDSIDK